MGSSRKDLAKKSGIAESTAIGFGNGKVDPKVSAMLKWQRALEVAGIEFLDPTEEGKGEGVRFKSGRGRR